MSSGRTQTKQVRIYPADLQKTKEEGIVINADFLHSCITDRTSHVLNVEMEEEFPNFLYGYEANNKEIYKYLKKHPEAGPFFLQRYTSNRDYIRDLCDPTNPMYLPDLSESLGDVFRKESLESEIQTLRNERASLNRQMSNERENLKALQDESSTLAFQNEGMKTENDLLSQESANLREDKGMERVNTFYKNVMEFAKNVLDLGDLSNSDSWAQVATRTRTLNVDAIQNLTMIFKDAKQDIEYLQTSQFITEAYLTEQQAKMKREADRIKRENESLASLNLLKQVEKGRKLFDEYRGLVQIAVDQGKLGNKIIDMMNDHDAVIEKQQGVLDRVLGR